MKIPTLLCAAFFCLVSPMLELQADEKVLNEKEKIEALIQHVKELKGAAFIRNNSDYDSTTAAKFLRAKWGRAKDVKTATDFITKVASSSSTSGKPYLIRFKDGREVKCGDYLKAELRKLEREKD